MKSPTTQPPGAWGPLRDVVQRAAGPLERFLHIEAASGVVLLVAALFAFVSANSPWSATYASLWHAQIGIQIGPFNFARTLEWIVNDGLMVIFFFVVGLEIRREIHKGELSELRRAALPVIAAVGGVIAPAVIYFALARAPETRVGWSVPTATDIAFAVGILALLGGRVPPALRVLLLAVAVIDDLIAILVIATFYSSGVVWLLAPEPDDAARGAHVHGSRCRERRHVRDAHRRACTGPSELRYEACSKDGASA